MKGDEEDPHLVAESQYRFVPDAEHVKLPNVSGCAAVSLTVYGKSEAGGEERVLARIAFHSEGQPDRSREATDAMAAEIRDLPGREKRVTAVAILNGHQYDSRSDHQPVLEQLKRTLADSRNGRVAMSFEFGFERLIRQTQEQEDIDLTGGEEASLQRYGPRLGFDDEERAAKTAAFRAYSALVPQARSLDVFKKYFTSGRGHRRTPNPNYVRYIPPAEFGKLEPEDAQAAVADLQSMIQTEANRSCCVIA